MKYTAKYDQVTDKLTIVLENGKWESVFVGLVLSNMNDEYLTQVQRLSNATKSLLTRLSQ